MNYRALGSTGIYLSEIGYGASALFGKDVLGKQGMTDNEAYELITTAIQHGVSFFDTGINYGYAEERLGKCIRKAIGNGVCNRSDVIIETKCGETVNPDGSYGEMNYSPEWIKQSLEISLKRLGMDSIDMFAMHGGTIKACTDKLIFTFQDMKAQGLIKSYGINTFNTELLEWIAKERCFDYVMLDYNILKQEREPLIQRLYESGVGVIAGAALGQSVYARRRKIQRNNLWYFVRSLVKGKELKRKGKMFDFLNDYSNYTANQIALRYLLDNHFLTSAVFNTTSIEHLLENLGAIDITLPNDIVDKIRECG